MQLTCSLNGGDLFASSSSSGTSRDAGHRPVQGWPPRDRARRRGAPPLRLEAHGWQSERSAVKAKQTNQPTTVKISGNIPCLGTGGHTP